MLKRNWSFSLAARRRSFSDAIRGHWAARPLKVKSPACCMAVFGFILSATFSIFALSANALAATIPLQTVNVEFVFTDNSNNEDGFRVYRCAGIGCIPTVEIKTLPANTTTFSDTILGDVGAASYTYAVSAYNSAGESASRATATIVTPAIIEIPSAPAGLIATIRGVTIQ